jgi:hypothetical protein
MPERIARTEEIEKIIEKMECPEGFACYKSGFRNLCKAKEFGIESVLECLEENPFDCSFAHAYGHLYFCKCPMRAFIAEKLKK